MSAHGIAVELTRITKDAGPVTKRIHLMPDGSIGNDSSRCAIGKGTMDRLYLPDWRAFAKLIEETQHGLRARRIAAGPAGLRAARQEARHQKRATWFCHAIEGNDQIWRRSELCAA
jgi:hypothetical protein